MGATTIRVGSTISSIKLEQRECLSRSRIFCSFKLLFEHSRKRASSRIGIGFERPVSLSHGKYRGAGNKRVFCCNEVSQRKSSTEAKKQDQESSAINENVRAENEPLPKKGSIQVETVGSSLALSVSRALLAATLLTVAVPPPPAEAVHWQILPEANFTSVVVKQASNLIKGVQQNPVVEKTAEQVEVQVQGLLTADVRDYMKKAQDTLHLDQASASVNTSFESLQSSAEQLKTALESSYESLKDQLSRSLIPGVAASLNDVPASLESAGQGLDANLQQQIQNLQGSLESVVGKGENWKEPLKEGLQRAQQELAALQSKLASGVQSQDQPVQDAINRTQESVGTALNYLEGVATDALSLVPLRSPSLTAAAQGTLSRLGLFELFGFVIGQGERWLVFGPSLLLLAAGWNAFKNRAKERRREEKRLLGPSPAVRLRSVRVQRELVKLRIKAQLFDAIERLGKGALAPASDPVSNETRQEVESLIKQLKDTRVEIDPVRLGSLASDPFADISPAPDIDGRWQLVFSTEPLETRGLSPGQLSALLPDLVMDSITQHVTSVAPGSATTGVPQIAPVKFAENSARLTLAGVGTFEVSIQGKWEDQPEADVASVSFDTFSALPLELFGRKVDGFPQVQLSVPAPLRQSAEWSTLYVDEDTRISQSKRGTFYLFRRLTT